MGIMAAAREAVDHLTREELDGFFIHLDDDCLDDAPCRQWISVCWASGKAVGIEITIYNPLLDEDSGAGRGLVDVLAH